MKTAPVVFSNDIVLVFAELLVEQEEQEMQNEKIQINLLSPDGEGINILAVAEQLATDLEIDYGPIFRDMTSGDYDHLLEVFLAEFGEFVNVFPELN